MFTRCHRPAKKKSLGFSLLLSKNGCCNAALEVQIKKGWSYTVQSLRQLADIPQSSSFSFRQVMYLLYYMSTASTKFVGRLRTRAVC